MRSENKKSIAFDTIVYSVAAVKYAIYDLGFIADISLQQEGKIQVTILSPKPCSTDIENKIKEAVLDHQIRIDVEKEFSQIRKLILAQAFFPCENLDQLLDGIDL